MPKYKSKTKFLLLRSMKLKIVSVFVLMVVAIILVIGTFLFIQVSNFYYNDFQNEMNRVFSETISTELQSDLQSATPESALLGRLSAYSGSLGIDSYRNFYLLSPDAKCLGSSEAIDASTIALSASPNLIDAMAGSVGSRIQKGAAFMDYAYPVQDQGATRFILYVRDDKSELSGVLYNIFHIIFEALGVGILISILFGFLLSNTITLPISNVTRKAQRIASGDFDQKIEVKSKDEIGRLTNSFNYMANELKSTLDEMANEKNKMETILHTMADGVIAFDHGGNIIHINPAAMEIFSIKEPRHASFDDIFSNLDDGLTLYDLLYIQENNMVERQFTIGSRYIKTLFAPFITEQQKKAGVIAVLQDVTISQRMDNSRREFVANVSHELRTPLTTVKTYIETLLDSNLQDPEMAMRFLSVIDVETERMTRLIKDLLTLSRLDYSDEIKRSRLSVDQLAHDVTTKFSLEAKNAGLALRHIENPKLPSYYGDRDRMEQVLTNILSNAIKYTPRGGSVEVSTYHKNEVLYICIKDTGIGIPKKDLARIFERFYRVDKARSREYGGTGLGLAIAKEIVEKFKGSIDITSEVGSGTSVTIALPLIF